MTKDELKLVLAVLKSNDTWGSSIREAKERAIAAIKEDLAHPEQASPMSEPNRAIAYAASSKLHELGYRYLDGEWVQTEEPEQEPAACAECERLKDALKRANDQAEHFEREWYLRGDEIEQLNAQPEQKPVTWAGVDFDINTTPPQRKPLTLDELKALWNSQADQMNQWDELGIDEIVAFAQDAHGIKENT
jgi:hypothetical protein